MGTDRKRVQPAIAARDRGQGRLRAVTVAIGAASVLAGGGIALGLPAAAHTQPSSVASRSQGSTGKASSGATSGSGQSGSSSAGSSSAASKPKSSSSSLKSTSAPASSSGSGQVTSGGS